MSTTSDQSTLAAVDLHVETSNPFVRPCAGCGDTEMLRYAQGPVFATADRTAVCDSCVVGIAPTMLDALATVRDLDDIWKTAYYAGIDSAVPERADTAMLDATEWLRTVAHGVFELFASRVGLTQGDLEAFRARVNERVDQMAAFREVRAQIEASR